MNELDRQILLWANGLVGGSAGVFEAALLLCGALPLVVCVMVLLALWWTDPEGGPSRDPVLGGGPRMARTGLLVSRRRCVALALAVALAFVCTRLVAFATELPRPLGRETLQVPLEPGRWQDLVAGMTGFGAFPSDHAALFFALAVGLFAWSRMAGMAGLAVAGLFSVARVMVGFHYPSDMIAGGLLGAALAAGGMAVARRPRWALDSVVDLFRSHPALMYPLLFVLALDFTQHFRMVFSAVFYFLFGLLGSGT